MSKFVSLRYWDNVKQATDVQSLSFALADLIDDAADAVGSEDDDEASNLFVEICERAATDLKTLARQLHDGEI